MQVVVVDNHLACIGGLDFCFGRWDTHNHPLADAHPTDFARTLFPGQDFNNARFLDFQDVQNYISNAVSILEMPRMPWHDVGGFLEHNGSLTGHHASGSYDDMRLRGARYLPAFRRALE